MTIPCIEAQSLEPLGFSLTLRAAVATLSSFGDESGLATDSLTLGVPEAGVTCRSSWVGNTSCSKLPFLLSKACFVVELRL